MKITGDNIIALDNAIKAVCPIDGISSTGRIDFKPEATEAQRAAARDLMEAHLAAPEAP